MKKFDINDYELEIIALQKEDTKMAKDNGFLTKKSWFEHICKESEDKIAQAIIDIAERYELPLERVAYDFDPTMTMRVGKIYAQKNTESKGKAA